MFSVANTCSGQPHAETPNGTAGRKTQIVYTNYRYSMLQAMRSSLRRGRNFLKLFLIRDESDNRC